MSKAGIPRLMRLSFTGAGGDARTRLMPFLGIGLISLALIPTSPRLSVGYVLLSVAVGVTIVGATMCWPALAMSPRAERLTVPMILAVALLRHGAGRGPFRLRDPVRLPDPVGRDVRRPQGADPHARVGHARAADPVRLSSASRAIRSGSWNSVPVALAAYTMIGFTAQMLLRGERATAADRVRLLDLLNDGIIVTDMTGRVIEVNAALVRLFGYPESELVGHQIPLPAWPVADRDDLMRRHLEIVAEGLRGARGPPRAPRRPQRARAHPPRRRRRPRTRATKVIGTVKDVTESVRLRETLRAERDRSAAILAAIEEGFAVTRGGMIVDANPALCEITGFKREELLGATFPVAVSGPRRRSSRSPPRSS